MTVLSRKMYDCAVNIRNTDDAARILREYRQYRTLGDVLRAFSEDEQLLRKTLVEGLLQWNPEDVQASVDRKVRNWLGGKTQTIDKEDAYVLSRILGLSLEKTDDFLKKASGEGIHWRNPRDIVWCYAIAQNLPGEKIRQLLTCVENMGADSGKKAVKVPESYTTLVYQKLRGILYRPEAELLAFLEEEWENLGAFHNTAYQQFTRYMRLLEEGFSDGDIEATFEQMTQAERRKKQADADDRKETARREAAAAGRTDWDAATLENMDGDTELYRPQEFTTREVLESYLYRSLVPVRERGQGKKDDPFQAIRRSIRQSWPDESSLSRMKKRQIDVTRKVLILLFLATDGSSTDFAEMDEDEELYGEEEIFLDIYTRLNLMLSACGFLSLDPRSAFDWMILFCISAGDLWESDERLRAMLLEMFPEEA